MKPYLRFDIRMKLGSTLQSMLSRRQREHVAAGFCTISHRSCRQWLESESSPSIVARGCPAMSRWSMTCYPYLLLLAFITSLAASAPSLPSNGRNILHHPWDVGRPSICCRSRQACCGRGWSYDSAHCAKAIASRRDQGWPWCSHPICREGTSRFKFHM